MAILKVKYQVCKCERCNHEWIPSKDNPNPKMCPHCKSLLWNVPKKPKPDLTKALKYAIDNENGTDTLVER